MAEQIDDVELTMRVAALLGEIPGWAWRLDGPAYTAAEVGIFYGRIRAEPDRGVGVRVYYTDDSQSDLSIRRMQLRFRGEPHRVDGADALSGEAFRHLHRLVRRSQISLATRISSGPLGADTNAREERTDNYQIILDNPEASS